MENQLVLFVCFFRLICCIALFLSQFPIRISLYRIAKNQSKERINKKKNLYLKFACVFDWSSPIDLKTIIYSLRRRTSLFLLTINQNWRESEETQKKKNSKYFFWKTSITYNYVRILASQRGRWFYYRDTFQSIEAARTVKNAAIFSFKFKKRIQ